MTRLFYVALCACVVTSSSVFGQDSVAFRIDSAVVSATRAGFNGAILVARGETVLLDTVIGVADLTTGRRLARGDRFDLASVSKQFTAAAILQLVGSGRLRLTQRVAEVLPGFPYPDVTVEHLLRHQSGLPDYLDYESFVLSDSIETVDNAAILANLLTDRPALDTVPGAIYRYSNTGYAVLASLLEAVSGQSYAGYLREHLFVPAGMTSSAVSRHYGPSADTAVHAYSPDEETGALVDVALSPETADYYRYFDGVVGDGAVHATVADMHRWWRGLLGGRVLDTALVRAMWTPDDVSVGYGFGLERRSFRGRGLVSHAGGWAGFNNFVFYDPPTDRYFVLLSNREYDSNVLGQLAGDLLTATAAE